MIFHTDFSDGKRLKEIIQETKSRLQMKMNGSGHTIALARAMSYFSELAQFSDGVEGISYYRFLCDLEEHFEEKKDGLVAIFKQILEYVLCQEHVIVSITGDEDGYAALTECGADFLKLLKEKRVGEKPQADLSFLAYGKNEGLKTAGQIQYVARAGNFVEKGLGYHGALHILKVILSYDY